MVSFCWFSLQKLESSSMASIVAFSFSTPPSMQDPTLVEDVSKSLFLHYGENLGDVSKSLFLLYGENLGAMLVSQPSCKIENKFTRNVV